MSEPVYPPRVKPGEIVSVPFPEWPPDREIRMRCIEAAVRMKQYAVTDSVSTVTERAGGLLEWVLQPVPEVQP